MPPLPLLGLNQLWGLGQSREALQQVAASLGADVPFFVFGRPALARGVGERLLAVTMPVTDYVLAFPGAGVATANVFTDPQLKRDTPANAGAVFMLDHGHNDLQPVAERLEPRIGALLADLAHLCPPGIAPRMTGSGACVFAGLTITRPPAKSRDNLSSQAGKLGRPHHRPASAVRDGAFSNRQCYNLRLPAVDW